MQAKTPLRGALLGALFLAAFLVTSTGLRMLFAPASGDEAGPKLAYLEGHIAEYDTFFIGSSVVFRHVVPAVFDRRRAELGAPTRSYNLGSPGMTALEGDRVLRELFQLLPEGSGARIFIEPTEPKALVVEGQETTERAIAWHDFEGTRLALELIPREELGLVASAQLAKEHLRAFFWNRTNYAQGQRLLRRLLPSLFPPRPGGLGQLVIEQQAGYQALEDSADPATIARGEAFRGGDGEDLAVAVAKLTASKKRPPKSQERDSVRQALLDKRRAEAAERGAELDWLIPPTLRPMPWARRAADRPRTFAYNAPRRFPEYFQARSHFDRNHLKRESAAAFSQQLAEDTAAAQERP